MPDAHHQAIAYFRNSADDPWRWAENGKVLVWSDGTTVAFREELADILELLAIGGLPPFHAVVLLLAACRGKFPQPALPGVLVMEETFPPSQQLMQRPWHDPANQEFSELLAQLRALHQLPAELRNSPKAKAALIEAVFEGRSESRIQPAREIIEVLRRWVLLDNALNQSLSGSAASVDSYRFIQRRLKELSLDVLNLRMQTGLDELPGEADLDLKPAERVRQLLGQLRTDPEHEGLARVARDVMAALYLPRALSEMDELALGGFSDISNRGNLDRLLPSELANDDLALAARIALNEALYFRREPPANHPPGRFAVLLDAGVRTWGLPRVFATAVALALMGREEQRGEVTTWRATKTGVDQINFLSRRGLIDHLATLNSCAHPGASLKPFFAQFQGASDLEAVLVTHRDTLDDPDFQSQLREVTSATFYIATVDRDGSFEMFLHPHRNSPLCQAVISLESLFATSSRQVKTLRDSERDPNLPLILSLRPFPFLSPVVGKIQKAIRFSTNGGIAVMQDRRLLRWENTRQGAEMLAGVLPKGKTLWLGISNFGHKVHVLKHRGNQPLASLTTWNSETDDLVNLELPLPDEQTARAFSQNGVLFLVNRRRIIAFDMDTGQSLGTIAPPEPRLRSCGKYFIQADGSTLFLAYDGQSLQFHPVSLRPSFSGKDILALFDREGFEGPWMLTTKGEIYSNTGERVINLGRAIYGYELSSDGHRLLFSSIGESRNFQFVDLETTRCTLIQQHEAQQALNPPIIPPTTNVRVHFEAIHLHLVGGLSLLDSSGTWRYLTDRDGKSLVLEPIQPPNPDATRVRKFEPVPISRAHPFRLKAAVWPDGRRAWLDSRGLLHLKHFDPALLEISLVLSDNSVAAWSSDNQMSGSAFFIPTSTLPIPIPLMMEKIHAFNPGW